MNITAPQTVAQLRQCLRAFEEGEDITRAQDAAISALDAAVASLRGWRGLGGDDGPGLEAPAGQASLTRHPQKNTTPLLISG